MKSGGRGAACTRTVTRGIEEAIDAAGRQGGIVGTVSGAGIVLCLLGFDLLQDVGAPETRRAMAVGLALYVAAILAPVLFVFVRGSIRRGDQERR